MKQSLQTIGVAFCVAAITLTTSILLSVWAVHFLDWLVRF